MHRLPVLAAFRGSCPGQAHCPSRFHQTVLASTVLLMFPRPTSWRLFTRMPLRMHSCITHKPNGLSVIPHWLRHSSSGYKLDPSRCWRSRLLIPIGSTSAAQRGSLSRPSRRHAQCARQGSTITPWFQCVNQSPLVLLVSQNSHLQR